MTNGEFDVKTIVISILMLGCFLLMANLAPSLLNTARPENEQDHAKSDSNQVGKSITSLVVLLVALVMVLHFWP